MRSTKAAFIWNILGSIAVAASSLLLLMFAGRAQGESAAGVFSIALAISQLFSTIGLFEMRNFQSSDLKEKYLFSDYFTFRIFACLVMMILSTVYIIFKGYAGIEFKVLFSMCVYKMFDSFVDVCYGMLQQKNKLEIAGKSLFFRTTICTILFIFFVYHFDDLLMPMTILNIVTLIWIITYDFYYTRKYEKKWISFNYENMKSLFIECLPLCICSFLSIYLINSPKYAIQSFASKELQGIFGYVFMPTSVINLFSIFILRPIIGDLSIAWTTGNKDRFIQFIRVIVLWIIVLTIGALVGGYFLGIPVLSILYSTNLTNYRTGLMIILVGGGFSALTTAFYYVLTVMRMQNRVLFTYGAVYLLSLLIVKNLAIKMNLIGASLGYAIVMLLLAIGLFITLIVSMKEIEKNKN